MAHDTHTEAEKVSPGAQFPKGADPELSVVSVAEVDARMRPTIVVICGLPRTGKHTFAEAVKSYADDDKRDTRIRVHNRSSIQDTKDFLLEIVENDLLYDAQSEPTEAFRNALSDIKLVLDKSFDYTLKHAEFLATTYSARDVFFYHVRETVNLRKLQYITNANFLSVHVIRNDRPETPLASSDKDGMIFYDNFKFDYVINSRLEDMPIHAALLYNRVARIYDGTDKPSNIVKRVRRKAGDKEATPAVVMAS